MWIVWILMLVAGPGCFHPQPAANSAYMELARYWPEGEQKAHQVLSRHQEELLRLPGVFSVASNNGQIHVYTDYPAIVPLEVEGVPIQTLPPGHVQRFLPFICPSGNGRCQDPPQ